MSNKTKKYASQKKLTNEEIIEAGQRLMAVAQAHQRASGHCLNNPDAKPPSIDALFFPTVSFELILLSIEQSLKLTLLIHSSVLKPTHDIYELYKTISSDGGVGRRIQNEIVKQVNTHLKSIGESYITEKDISTCLSEHDSSYSSFRYLGLDKEGRPTAEFGMKRSDIQLLQCLALALLEINWNEMGKRGMKVYESMSLVPEAEMTDELQKLMTRMNR